MKTLIRMISVCLMAAAAVLPHTVVAQSASQPASQSAPKPAFKPEEIEQLVAPIALYPDSLVAQILMASTYPLEVVEAARWVKQNPKVTGKALQDAMQNQTWDPSVKSLAAFPQVLTMMNDKLDMTQKLGDAFLGQQKEVMDSIQRLRSKAQAAGNLKSGKEQTVDSAQEGGSTVIKIEPAQPDVVYVPTYDPTLVYGAWPYPAFPPYYWYPPGYAAGAAVFGFTAGVIAGSALWGHCDWGVGNVNVNVNKFNSFNNTNISNSNWTHNSAHHGGVPYRDAATQQKYGKGQLQNAAARQQFRGRAEQGRQQIARGDADRFKGGGFSQGAFGERGGMGNRGGSGAAGLADRGFGGGGFQHAGGRGGAFEGMSFGGGQTREFSNRGAFSRGGFGGGGFRGGGFRRR